MMRAAGWGRVINVALGAWADRLALQVPPYVAAKHGIVGLTKVVALETAEEPITANAICPGYVMTPLVERQIPDTMKKYGMDRETAIREVLLDRQPSKQFRHRRAARRHRAVSCCSAHAAQITGTTISVDGGLEPRCERRAGRPFAPGAHDRPQAHQPRAPGRRRAWRVHVGRCSTGFLGGRSDRGRRHLGHLRRRAQRPPRSRPGSPLGRPNRRARNLDWLWAPGRAPWTTDRLAPWLSAVSPMARLLRRRGVAGLSVGRMVVSRGHLALHDAGLERPRAAPHRGAVPLRGTSARRRGPEFPHLRHQRAGPAKIRVFTREAITADAILASACLPTLFPRRGRSTATPIGDGGYTGKPGVVSPCFDPSLPDDHPRGEHQPA